MPGDDRLAAELAEIKRRAGEAVEGWRRMDVVDQRDAWQSSAEDVPSLVKALEAALRLIGNAKPIVSGYPADCANACADGPCNCSGKTRPLAWDLDPAALREAITRELTGPGAA
jgi:hypothetical protein